MVYLTQWRFVYTDCRRQISSRQGAKPDLSGCIFDGDSSWRLKEEVIQLRKEKKRLSDDVEFYKGKIKNMSDRTELLQEKADDLERVKRYAGAEQIDTIIRKVKEQERTEQQIRKYDRSYVAR